jgi:hypothetical protein
MHSHVHPMPHNFQYLLDGVYSVSSYHDSKNIAVFKYSTKKWRSEPYFYPKKGILIILCPWILSVNLELCWNPEGNINSARSNLYIVNFILLIGSVNYIHFKLGETQSWMHKLTHMNPELSGCEVNITHWKKCPKIQENLYFRKNETFSSSFWIFLLYMWK